MQGGTNARRHKCKAGANTGQTENTDRAQIRDRYRCKMQDMAQMEMRA